MTASGIAMAADWLFLFEAFQQMGVSLSIIINYIGPAIAVAASVILFKDQMTVSKIVCLGAALLGAVLVNSFSTGSQINAAGLICAILSAFSYAAMVIFNKCSKEITGTQNAVIQLFVTAVTVTVYMGISYGFQMNIPEDNWTWILCLSLINTGIGCFFYFSSISSLPVQTVAVCGYIEPLSAVLFSLIFLHEALVPLQWVGGLLIIGGALFSESSRFINKKGLSNYFNHELICSYLSNAWIMLSFITISTFSSIFCFASIIPFFTQSRVIDIKERE